MVDVDKALSIMVKTGKVVFGARNAVQNAQTGKAKLIVIAANCPTNIRSDIEYYSKISGVPVVVYRGTSVDLGMACGKPFMVSALSVKEPGDSDILKLIEQPEIEEELEEKPFESEEFFEDEEPVESAEEEAIEVEEDVEGIATEDEGNFEGEDVND
ncbi:MAG: 50S ribosomal protein L30e [Candidatus Bathyarchaeales archaeon]